MMLSILEGFCKRRDRRFDSWDCFLVRKEKFVRFYVLAKIDERKHDGRGTTLFLSFAYARRKKSSYT